MIFTDNDPFAALLFLSVFLIDISGYRSVTKSVRLAFLIINVLSTTLAIS